MGATASALRSPETAARHAQVPAGIVSRALGLLVDLGLLALTILVAAGLTAVVATVLPRYVRLQTAVSLVALAFSAALPMAYFSGALAIGGQTVGKALMGIRVVRLDGRPLRLPQSILRAAAYLVSALPLFAGFWWVLLDRERRGWHDHLARSRVVYVHGRPRP